MSTRRERAKAPAKQLNKQLEALQEDRQREASILLIGIINVEQKNKKIWQQFISYQQSF